MSDEDSVHKAVEEAVAQPGRLDVLCNVAGVMVTAHTHEMKLDEWNRIQRVNAITLAIASSRRSYEGTRSVED